MNRFLLVSTVWLLALVLQTTTARAQDPCDTCQFRTDDLALYAMIDGDTSAAMALSPYWQFEQASDSSRIIYRAAQFEINGHQIHLDGWRRGNTLTTSLDSLADASRTGAVLVATGDSLSFFRYLNWYNPITELRTVDNFNSPDTVDFVVELVSDSSGNRVAMIDSLGIDRQVPAGGATLHGSRPIVARATYVVPSSLNGTKVFFRVLTYLRGDGTENPLRFDGLTADSTWIWMLEDSTWQDFIATFGGGLGKPSVDLLEAADEVTAPAVALDVAPNPTRGAVTISVHHLDRLDGNRSALSLSVYDERGRLVFIPYVCSLPQETVSVRYRFNEGGTYFVALRRGSSLIAVRRIVVTP